MNDIPKQKTYLVMVNETIVPFIMNLLPSIQFVEVEALNMKDNEDYVLLANPKPAKEAVLPAIEQKSESIEEVRSEDVISG